MWNVSNFIFFSIPKDGFEQKRIVEEEQLERGWTNFYFLGHNARLPFSKLTIDDSSSTSVDAEMVDTTLEVWDIWFHNREFRSN